MTSQLSEFKLLDRGFQEVLLLIPGWATDHKIFMNMNLRYNYLLPIQLHPFHFEKELLRWVEENSVNSISLFGWSLGGFLACDVASKNPDWIGELILVSIHRGFEPNEIESVRINLKKNRKAFLYKFYLECFSQTDSEGLTWFKKHLLEKYLKQAEEGLRDGLDYLSDAKINPDALTNIQKIRIFHGEEDTIAPLKEARDISNLLPQAVFCPLKSLGHIPFLNHTFKERFNNG